MTVKHRVDHIAIEEDAILKFQFALIDAMNESGLTKADLAKALGVSKSRVSQLLDSEANPTLKVMARAVAFFGLEIDYCSIERSTGRKSKSSSVEQALGLSGFLSIIHDSEPMWDIREARHAKPANEDRYWDYVQAA